LTDITKSTSYKSLYSYKLKSDEVTRHSCLSTLEIPT